MACQLGAESTHVDWLDHLCGVLWNFKVVTLWDWKYGHMKPCRSLCKRTAWYFVDNEDNELAVIIVDSCGIWLNCLSWRAMQQLHGYTTKITSQQATQKRKFRRLFLLVWSSDLLPGLHNSQEKTQNCRNTKFKLAPFSTSKTFVLTGQIWIDTGFSEVRNTMRHRENPVCFSRDWLANGEHPSVVFLPNEAGS